MKPLACVCLFFTAVLLGSCTFLVLDPYDAIPFFARLWGIGP